jgi:hypothetical protein
MSPGKLKRQLLYSVPPQTTALPKAHKWTTQIEDLRGSSISAQKSLNIIVQRLTAPIRWCHGGPIKATCNLEAFVLGFGAQAGRG